jgi:16S rRNA (cytidine1402-2'-O)-methyltransferase
MPTGTLYVVATPIGNLEDITLRAVRVLREVDLIAAEDTRRTARLLQHYGIPTPTVSLHAHNERRRSGELLGRLLDGRSVALVSDAGTPLISDPGLELVRAARNAGITVTAIPGPTAIATILSAAGVPTDRFLFAGFPPRRSSDRIGWMKETVRGARVPVVVFEAPHRVRQFLSNALAILGDRPIIIGRELTKIHEQVVECLISEALKAIQPRGEFTLLFPPVEAPITQPEEVGDPARLRKEVGELTETGRFSLRKASAIVAERYGLKTNAVYRIVTA